LFKLRCFLCRSD